MYYDIQSLCTDTKKEEFPELKTIGKKTSSSSLHSAWGSKKSFVDLLKSSDSAGEIVMEEQIKKQEKISSTIEIINDRQDDVISEKTSANEQSISDWIIDDDCN